ncbi:MAG: HAMP domain-containing histidine kinase [Acidimicrobiia bacterium]|nr:HAMP domain-containing histidine kinase [Acidimicrobiia bacterium]
MISNSATRLKAAILAGGLAVAVILMAVSAIFANAYGAKRASQDAVALHQAETLLAASAILRTQVGQSALISTYVDAQPTSDASAAGVARAEAGAALDQFDEAVLRFEDSYEVAGTSEQAQIAAFGNSAGEVLANIDAGDLDAANGLLNAALNVDYADLVGVVVSARDGTVNDLATAQTVVGRVSEISRFLVAFLIPSAAILLYRAAARRQNKQKELEARLEAQRELNKAKDEFVASVSHELRTPLTSIYGFAQLLGDGAATDPATTRELVGLIRGETDELSRMVEDLLTAARADAGALAYHLEAFSARTGVERALAPLIKGGEDIRMDVVDAQVYADDFRFRQIVRNLVSNARRYGAAPIGVRGLVVNGAYQLTVYDHGQGVAPHVEERMFQRFVHQGHQPLLVGSVGLGLSIVRILAEGMSGSAAYERANGETRFIITFPIADSRAEAPPELLAG